LAVRSIKLLAAPSVMNMDLSEPASIRARQYTRILIIRQMTLTIILKDGPRAVH
jgi:hypothetical protein